ncbi:LON peptidase N-terminal domain and RING finger protein 3-like isoform X2 [Oscarella lobularis]|uniref:LON peptidase N-terminal domain and RING finger protein 3-like isoform X2 n=1 Tax=Oscarella lobularis TaxID=121494 RepID=UPI0033132B7F
MTETEDKATNVGEKLENFLEFIRKRKADSESTSNDSILACRACTDLLFEPITFASGSTLCSTCVAKLSADQRLFNGTAYKPNVILTNLVRKCLPDRVRAVEWRQKGNEAFAAGNASQALDFYAEGLKLGPNYRLFAKRSKAFYARGDFLDALREAEMALKMKPDSPKGCYLKCRALERLGKSEEAVSFGIIAVSLEHPNMDKISQIKERISQRRDNTSVLIHLLERTTQEISSSSSSLGSKVDYEIPSHLITDEDFECVLCRRLLFEPVTLPCGHVFCRSCMNRSLDHRPFCPSCRTPLHHYLATFVGREQPITVALEKLIQKFFQTEYKARQAEQEQELQQVAGPTVEQLATPSSSQSVEVDIPVFVCVAAYPHVACPLHIFEPRYRLMMRRCIESGTRQFGMCKSCETNRFSDVGTMLIIRDAKFLPDGRSLIDTVGGRRFKVLSRGTRDGYNTARVTCFSDDKIEGQELIGEIRSLNKDVYRETKAWFESLLPPIQARFEQQFGEFPSLEETEVDQLPDGPAWVWWMHAAFQEQIAEEEVLKATNTKERILRTKELREYHGVLSNICRQM